MYPSALNTLARVRALSQSDLARAAGVSRQAVSRWFHADRAQGGAVAIKSTHLSRLSESLNISVESLLKPLAGLDSVKRAELSALLLWDRLYPDLDAFLIAVANMETRALARLVDRLGLFATARIAGSGVWKQFAKLKPHLRKDKADAFERLWTLQKNLGLI